MTLLALHGGMLPHQREARPVVVERRLLPGSVVVALLTFRPFLTLMFIVFLMAGVTVHGRLFIPVVRMAVFARHLHMLMAKLVASLVVIESNLFPISIRVTIRAGTSHRAFVFIVLLVTAVTI